MRTILLAAGMGRRLGLADGTPKSLLTFAGQSLLARHLRILRSLGVARVELCVGYGAEAIEAELRRLGLAGWAATTRNPDFAQGSAVSLWTMRETLRAGEPVLFMDADVLYDQRMIARLLGAPHANAYLMDRALEPGDEPVKLCLRDGVLVELDKRPRLPHDSAGEWVGFARFAPAAAALVADALDRMMARGEREAPYEDAFREVLVASPPGAFAAVDASDLPWIEIDFPADLRRAERDILPLLLPLPAELRR